MYLVVKETCTLDKMLVKNKSWNLEVSEIRINYKYTDSHMLAKL